MHREGAGIPRIMTQAPSPPEKGNVVAPLWPPLTRSHDFIHLGEGTGHAAPGHVPSTSPTPTLHPYTLLGCARKPGSLGAPA